MTNNYNDKSIRTANVSYLKVLIGSYNEDGNLKKMTFFNLLEVLDKIQDKFDKIKK